MTLFERVKKMSKERGLSLLQLNDKAGLGKNAIYKWKTQKPSTENIQKVASALGVTVDYLLEENNTPEWATEKDTLDLEDFLSGNLKVNMAYGGEDLTDEEIERLKIAMTQIFWDKRKQEK